VAVVADAVAAAEQAPTARTRVFGTTPAERAAGLGAVACPDDPAALCGQFTVKLDRRSRTDTRTAQVDFRFIPHAGTGRAVSTMWWNGGGPGPSTTRNELWVPGLLLGDLAASFDVLLTDVRGTGSTAPACPEAQGFVGYGPGPAGRAATQACAASIIDRIDTYGSYDSAADLNELRNALGIPKLDIIGNSYGAMPATAYAVRFPSRTRSLTLSSPVDVEDSIDSFMRTTAEGVTRIVTTLCERSAACSAGIPDARAALDAGLRRLRVDPPTGVSVSVNDPAPQRVTLDEATLFSLLEESDGTFLSNAGEVPAALIALGRGDSAPALRIAADFRISQTFTGDAPPPEVDSFGGYSAIECTDYSLPWTPGLSRAGRLRSAADAVQRLERSGAAAPFLPTRIVTRDVYADWQQLINCNSWPDVRAPKPTTRSTAYPHVPTFVVVGDFDTRTTLESARRTAARWPNGQLLNIGSGLHGAVFWSCGRQRLQAFLTFPGSPQAPCDPAEFPAFRAVGNFPTTSSMATPLAIDQAGDDESTAADRRIASAAMDAALDANNVTNRQYVAGTFPGLRGGTATSSFTDSAFILDLVGYRFAADVAVTGRLDFQFDGSTPTIDLTLVTDRGVTGELHATGEWNAGRSAAAPRSIPVTGRIGGRTLSLTLLL
jgi:pimeloyl-ACP methyl ester carboxylesterase